MRVIMDDAGDIPGTVIEELKIKIVPVNIHFGTEEFLSGIDIDRQGFYEKVKTVGDHNFPKTSQPNPYQFTQVFEALLAEGETEFFIVTVGQKVSKTYDSAIAAQREMGDRATIHVFDSEGGSAAQGYLAIEAARMAAQGAAAAEIQARLERMRGEMVVVFMIDSLDYAIKGGRVSSFRGALASFLNIKPIMRLTDGEIVEEGRVRTYKKAEAYILAYVQERVGNRPVKLATIHAGAEMAGKSLMEKAEARLNHTESLLVNMTLPVAINLGPGALGLVAIPED